MAGPPTAKSCRPRRARRWFGRIALAVVGALVASLLGEALVRVVCGEQPKFPRHVVGAPWGIRFNEPSSRYRHRSADVDVAFHINRNGMRADRDYDHAKPAGTKRIVSLGDSFTIGYEVEREQCFSSVLEARLRAAGIDVEVLNCGVSGFGTAEECIYLERELLKYEPDLVLVSFFENDLDDNVRSGLFRVEGGVLLPAAERYVPAGGLGDFLNTSRLFNFLSERSDAFTLVKETVTMLVKRRVVAKNEATIAAPPAAAPATAPHAAPAAAPNSAAPAAPDPELLRQMKFCALLYERIYAMATARSIPLVIQSIPDERLPDGKLVDSFPLADFDVKRPGILYLPTKELLDPLEGKELLYWRRSHHHWTPLAHRLAGEELARRILAAGLLR